MLDTTRAYARTRLIESGESRAVARRHALYFLGALEARRAGPETAERIDALPDISSPLDPSLLGNVRAALEWSFSECAEESIRARLAAASAPLFLELSLLGECYRWCERAINVLDNTFRETRLEMEIQKALAISAMFTKGNGDDVLAAIRRGLELAERLEDRDGQMQMFAGLNIFLTRIGDFRGAHAVAEKCEIVARSQGSPIGVMVADWMLGVSDHLIGRQAEARQHCESSLGDTPASDRKSIGFFGYDHRIRALVALARALWLLGFPDRAVKVARQTIHEAAILDHPITVCISLIYAVPVFFWCGAWSEAEPIIEQLIEYAAKHSLAPYHAVGVALKGEFLVRSGATVPGVELLRDALNTLRAERHDILVTAFACTLAEGLATTGQFDEAATIIDGAIAQAERAGGSFDLPEIVGLPTCSRCAHMAQDQRHGAVKGRGERRAGLVRRVDRTFV